MPNTYSGPLSNDDKNGFVWLERRGSAMLVNTLALAGKPIFPRKVDKVKRKNLLDFFEVKYERINTNI